MGVSWARKRKEARARCGPAKRRVSRGRRREGRWTRCRMRSGRGILQRRRTGWDQPGYMLCASYPQPSSSPVQAGPVVMNTSTTAKRVAASLAERRLVRPDLILVPSIGMSSATRRACRSSVGPAVHAGASVTDRTSQYQCIGDTVIHTQHRSAGLLPHSSLISACVSLDRVSEVPVGRCRLGYPPSSSHRRVCILFGSDRVACCHAPTRSAPDELSRPNRH